MPTRRDFLVGAGIGVAFAEPRAAADRNGSSTMSIQLSKVVRTTKKSMDGLSVQSLELGRERSSPVVVVDDFRVSGRPFGPHPHAGFSAMTYVFRDSPGSLRNRDSLGGHVVVGPGGLCWLQAGSGAQHEEIPAESGAELLGLQVFVNTSAQNKLAPPQSFSLPRERVPVWTSTAGDEVRVAVGSYEGMTSPLVPGEPFTLLDVELRREVRFGLPQDHNAVVYVRSGDAVVRAGGSEQPLSAGQAVIAFGGAGAITLHAEAGAQVVLMAGPEIREPVVLRGPFMMNDASQIEAAAERYRSGRMGHLEPFAGG